MRSRIRIAHIISPIRFYGKEKWLAIFMKYINRDAFPSIVIPVVNHPDCHLADVLAEIGVQCQPLIMPGKISWSGINGIVSILRENRVDIIHCHDYKSDCIGFFANAKLKCKIMSTPHGWSNKFDIKLQFYQFVSKTLLQAFDRVVIFAPHIMKFRMRDNVSIVRNFIEVSREGSTARVDNRLFSYIGRLTWLKRVEDIIAALRYTKNTTIQLQIIGDGKLMKRLENLARKYELLSRVTFVGFRDDAVDLLDSSICLVMASLTEGISRVVLEAMALGKPVIGTDINGINSVVRDGETGILVPLKNPKAIAAAMDVIVEDVARARRMGEAARRFILTHYSPERAVEQYEEIYRELIGE